MKHSLSLNDFRYIKLMLLSRGGIHNNELANKIDVKPDTAIKRKQYTHSRENLKQIGKIK